MSLRWPIFRRKPPKAVAKTREQFSFAHLTVRISSFSWRNAIVQRFLNRVQLVESFGRHLRNSDRDIGKPYTEDWSSLKVKAQSKFKFSIAFENSSTPGYTTEKIVQALAADTIPIYWGDPLVGRVFNEGRIINMNKLDTDQAIKLVMDLHQDGDAYLEYVNRPFFSASADLDQLTDHAILSAFSSIFDQPKVDAYRRNFHAWGPKYESRRRFEVEAGAGVVQLGKLCLSYLDASGVQDALSAIKDPIGAIMGRVAWMEWEEKIILFNKLVPYIGKEEAVRILNKGSPLQR